eukprot:1845703-Rhodomonas_salina.1
MRSAALTSPSSIASSRTLRAPPSLFLFPFLRHPPRVFSVFLATHPPALSSFLSFPHLSSPVRFQLQLALKLRGARVQRQKVPDQRDPRPL